MGWQTDVVCARREEARAVAAEDQSATDRPGFTCRGFDHIKLGVLLSLIREDEPEAAVERDLERMEVVHAVDEDGPAVWVVPSEFVAELAGMAGLTDSERNSLAAVWGATEEMEEWSEADVRELLQDLADLAETATLTARCVMIRLAP
jgi:signal transduction histidine kinase